MGKGDHYRPVDRRSFSRGYDRIFSDTAVLDNTRLGRYIQTASGGKFWPLDPRTDEIYLTDIAESLSNICRYNGHCRHFYSVAQHSVLVSMMVPPEDAKWGLMHDAAEAYVGDVVYPLKRIFGFADAHVQTEEKILEHVAERFGLVPHMPASVKEVDALICGFEMRILMPGTVTEEHLEEPRYAKLDAFAEAFRVEVGDLAPVDPVTAHRMFIRRFDHLFDDAGPPWEVK